MRGSRITSNGYVLPLPGFYREPDGEIRPIPDSILAETYTDRSGEVKPIPDSHAKQLARDGVEPLSADERARRMAMPPEDRREASQ